MFAGSVEYGLRSYVGRDGTERLVQELALHYRDLGTEPQRHLAIAFALLNVDEQPVTQIKALLHCEASVIVSSFEPAELKHLEEALQSSLAAPLRDSGFPPLLPRGVPLLRLSDGLTLPVACGGVDTTNVLSNLLGEHPLGVVKRERPIEPSVYTVMGFAGLVCCAFMHGLVVPIDVVKTRMQTTPGRYRDLGDGVRKIWNEEGFQGITSGWAPTLLGYSAYGVTVYPGYELFKRVFISAVGEANDAMYSAPPRPAPLRPDQPTAAGSRAQCEAGTTYRWC